MLCCHSSSFHSILIQFLIFLPFSRYDSQQTVGLSSEKRWDGSFKNKILDLRRYHTIRFTIRFFLSTGFPQKHISCEHEYRIETTFQNLLTSCVADVSGLRILDCPFGFLLLLRLFRGAISNDSPCICGTDTNGQVLCCVVTVRLSIRVLWGNRSGHHNMKLRTRRHITGKNSATLIPLKPREWAQQLVG
jgi:hypothetical protein